MNTIKKIVFFIMASVMIWTTACEEKNLAIVVEGVMLDTMSMYLIKGYAGYDTYNLTATVFPENATNQNLVWTSSNRDVATVTDNGLVTAVDLGEAKIFVTTVDGGFRMACLVLVFDKPIDVNGVSFTEPEITLELGTGLALLPNVVFDPPEATDKYLRWVSDDATIVSVTYRGYIDALKVGTTTIHAIARSSDCEGCGPWYYETTCIVTVVPAPIYVSDISLDKQVVNLEFGADVTEDKQTAILTATLTPTNPDNSEIEWESSDPSVVEVVSTGALTAKVTALKVGVAEISVIAKGGRDGEDIRTTCSVTVVKYYAPHEMVVDDGADLIATITDNPDKSVFYLEGAEYTVGSTSFSSSVTLIGASGRTKITTTGSFDINSPTAIEKIHFEGIDFVHNAGNYVFNCGTSSAFELGLIMFKDCSFDLYARSIFRVQTANSNVAELVFDNCIFKNQSSYCVVQQQADNKFDKIVIKNSTFVNIAERILRLDVSTRPIILEVENCTFYDLGNNQALFTLNNAANSNVTISNCIFAKSKNEAVQFLRAGSGSTTTSTNNYKTSDFEHGTSNTIDLIEYSGNSNDLFVAPTANPFDLGIKDASFAGKDTAGDPRWR